MTYDEVLKKFYEAGVDSASHDADELFIHFGGYGRSTMYLMHRIESDSPEFLEAVERRANREPLQYILGETYFYREKYKVTPDVLIPRSDTEHLVDYAVHNLPEGGEFLDLCTGSGCVAISVLANTKGTKAVGVDISDAALKIAEENAEKNGVRERLKLVKADVMNEVIKGKYDAILCNPPYVSESAYKELAPEIYHEPKNAFLGGEDGGDFYRHLTPIYKEMLNDGGFIAYEIGYDQAYLLVQIAVQSEMSFKVIDDYSGNHRVAILRK